MLGLITQITTVLHIQILEEFFDIGLRNSIVLFNVITDMIGSHEEIKDVIDIKVRFKPTILALRLL